MINSKVAVIIPIYHPNEKFNQLLTMLKKQKGVDFDVYIIDSASNLESYRKELQNLTYKIIKTDPKTFNHGGTRRQAAISCKEYPILVFMTQDAVPADENSISQLVSVFRDEKIGCAYGQQIGDAKASSNARIGRQLNYPNVSQIVSYKDIPDLKIKAAFCSDSFAAYRTKALQSVGWFPENVLFGEDVYVAGKMLLKGWNKAYCAEAKVYHSHEYTIRQEVQRYFDTGVFHSREHWLLDDFGKAEGAGVHFLLHGIIDTLKDEPMALPGFIIHSAAKYLGYCLGKKEKCLPLSLKKYLSAQPLCWERKYHR